MNQCRKSSTMMIIDDHIALVSVVVVPSVPAFASSQAEPSKTAENEPADPPFTKIRPSSVSNLQQSFSQGWFQTQYSLWVGPKLEPSSARSSYSQVKQYLLPATTCSLIEMRVAPWSSGRLSRMNWSISWYSPDKLSTGMVFTLDGTPVMKGIQDIPPSMDSSPSTGGSMGSIGLAESSKNDWR